MTIIYKNTKNLFFLLPILAVLLFSGCNKDEDEPVVTQWTVAYAVSEVLNDLKQFEPSENSYALNGATGGVVTNEGISVTFPPNAFALENGTPYTGTVTIKMQTIDNVSDMLLSGITATSNGELILSDGMLKMTARDASNNKLKLDVGKTMSLEFQNATLDPAQKLFTGNETTGDDNTIKWDSTDTKGRGGAPGGVGIDNIGQLFEYCNLDRWMYQTPLTDISVSTPAGYTNTNTECYIKYTGENSAAYIPANAGLQKFTTVGGHYQVVQGRAAKILVFAKVSGSYYYKEISIPAITANHSETVTSFTPTSLTGLKAVINAF